jgi:osmotically-inducible protein OsmY
MKKTNEMLQKDVQDALKWEPLLHAAEIGVTARDGVVTLAGSVSNYIMKLEAEHAAKNVEGVKVVVEKIQIDGDIVSGRTDNEVVTDILNAFKMNSEIPRDQVKIKVENGWVTLEGEFPWNYQRRAAEKATNDVAGVKGVTLNISIKPETSAFIEKEYITQAIGRNSSIDADDNIVVMVAGTKVTLSGTVSSLHDKEEAAREAWKAPGVCTVDNQLEVDNEYTD